MSNYPTVKIEGVIAASGDYLFPRTTADQAGAGHLSYEKGWNIETQMPLDEGGVPPFRSDFNGLANLFSQYLLWYQQGGIMRYSASLDYEAGNEVLYSNSKFRCIKPTGPGTTVVTPGTDKTVWKNLDAPSVLAGQVTAFCNCKLGGSDGRRLIPWGEDTADERYVICDGGPDGLGGTVPNLVNRFILPSTVANADQTGGKLEATTDNAEVSGSVGDTTLTISQIPAHGHTVSIGAAGVHAHKASTGQAGGHEHTAACAEGGVHSHTASVSASGSHAHTRGSMNVTGTFDAAVSSRGYSSRSPSGAFSYNGSYTANFRHMNEGAESWGGRFNFNASQTWTGETSSGGEHNHSVTLSSSPSHSHTVTVGNAGSHVHSVGVESAGAHSHSATVSDTGGGNAHTHPFTGNSHSHTLKVDLPPFYRLAFFVKLPE